MSLNDKWIISLYDAQRYYSQMSQSSFANQQSQMIQNVCDKMQMSNNAYSNQQSQMANTHVDIFERIWDLNETNFDRRMKNISYYYYNENIKEKNIEEKFFMIADEWIKKSIDKIGKEKAIHLDKIKHIIAFYASEKSDFSKSGLTLKYHSNPELFDAVYDALAILNEIETGKLEI